MSTKLLVDLDIVAYRAAFAAQKTKYLVECDGNADMHKTYAEYFDDAKAAKEAASEIGLGRIWSRKGSPEPVDKCSNARRHHAQDDIKC